jgi:hypothetical protein
MPLRPALAAMVVVVAMSGCSVRGSAGSTPSVSTDTLESTISDRLEAQVGQRPDSVSCPDRLQGTVGDTIRCTLSSGDSTYGITVTAKSVKDERVGFGIEVDEAPQAPQ